MVAEIVLLEAHDIAAIRDQLRHIYAAAFRAAPYQKSDAEALSFATTLPRHAERQGFRCAVAREVETGRALGFGYGYTGEPGQWWYDIVRGALPAAVGDRWMRDYFEVVELAVLPAAQGNGLGGKLHDALLTGLPHAAALLSTAQVETVALGLYRRRGWQTLLEYFYFPGVPEAYRIMGIELAREGEEGNYGWIPHLERDSAGR